MAEGGIVIIGAGIAGLSTALRLAPAPVTVVVGSPLGEGSATAWAQGGIAAAIGADDQPKFHAEDTVLAGAGLVDQTRALHLAGRCVDCGECERACPSQIPLGLLNRKVARIMMDRYGYSVTDDPSKQTPVGTFRLDDGQEFIE